MQKFHADVRIEGRIDLNFTENQQHYIEAMAKTWLLEGRVSSCFSRSSLESHKTMQAAFDV